MDNIFWPRPALIKDIIEENSQIKTFVLAFQEESYNQTFSYEPGQFMMVSMPHHGEAPVSISSSPTRPGALHLSVRRAGRLTGAMFALQKGQVIGLRGPYGRPFPIARLGGDLVLVAGGIGLAPLRSLINYVLDKGGEPGQKIILYGSRSPGDLAFRADLAAWRQRPDVTCLLTVDQAAAGWTEAVGLVTALLDKIDIEPGKSGAVVCGPPIMISSTLQKLTRMGFAEQRIWTTMERHMKCGQGTCGHCHLEGKMVCVDGPVFNGAELRLLQPSELRG